MELRVLVIGGLIPSILLGIGSVLMKLSLRNGISLSLYLMIVGAAVFLYGTVATSITHLREVNLLSGGYAFAMGISWATAIYFIAYGLGPLRLPVSIVAPLTNSNALVAVLISAMILSEWKNLNFARVLIGTLLITAGATIVSTAVQRS